MATNERISYFRSVACILLVLIALLQLLAVPVAIDEVSEDELNDQTLTRRVQQQHQQRRTPNPTRTS